MTKRGIPITKRLFRRKKIPLIGESIMLFQGMLGMSSQHIEGRWMMTPNADITRENKTINPTNKKGTQQMVRKTMNILTSMPTMLMTISKNF